MTFETALHARLKADAAVQATGAGIYWDERPQKSPFPAVVMQIITGMREQHMKGFQRLMRTRVQFDVMAVSTDENDGRATRDQLREAVIDAFAPPAEQDGISFDRAQNVSFVTRNGEINGKIVYVDQIDAMLWHRGL